MDWSDPMPTLRADKQIRAHFDLPPRANRGHQPWYLYATGVIDTAPRGEVEMHYRFDADAVPGACRLAMERPGDFAEVLINGAPAGAFDQWWVDEDIRSADVSGLLREGDNDVVLRFDYRPDMELEDLYLVGDFGVALRPGFDAPAPGAMTLTAPPRQLDAGGWIGQGLDFYGAAVRYRLTVAKPDGDRRVRLGLPGVRCTCAVIHVGDRQFPLPWPPFAADITDALEPGDNELTVEVIGGRKNILGPLHTPSRPWTGPGEFEPDNDNWTDAYVLNDHGLIRPPKLEILE